MKSLRVSHCVRSFYALLALLLVTSIAAGCGSSEKEHTHDHKKTQNQTDADHHDEEEGHEEEGHHHEPPHGGAMAELGDHFAHLELTHNPETGKLTVYILDGEAEGAIRLTVPELEVEVSHRDGEGQAFDPFNVKLLAIGNPLTGEQPGDTSEFEGRDDRAKSLKKFHFKVLTDFEVKGEMISDLAFDFPEGND